MFKEHHHDITKIVTFHYLNLKLLNEPWRSYIIMLLNLKYTGATIGSKISHIKTLFLYQVNNIDDIVNGQRN